MKGLRGGRLAQANLGGHLGVSWGSLRRERRRASRGEGSLEADTTVLSGKDGKRWHWRRREGERSPIDLLVDLKQDLRHIDLFEIVILEHKTRGREFLVDNSSGLHDLLGGEIKVDHFSGQVRERRVGFLLVLVGRGGDQVGELLL